MRTTAFPKRRRFAPRSEGRERVVRDMASPDELPERLQDLVLKLTECLNNLIEEKCAARLQQLQDAVRLRVVD